MRPSWHEYFMMLAKLISSRSTCNSRKVGAVIVKNNIILVAGYNGALGGQPHCSDKAPGFCFRRYMGIGDAEKYNYCVASHAESNAISQAARHGVSLEGGTLYCTLEPCNACLKQIIQAGITQIYFETTYDSENEKFDEFWRQTVKNQRGVKVYKQISVSDHAKNFTIDVLKGNSNRQIKEVIAI